MNGEQGTKSISSKSVKSLSPQEVSRHYGSKSLVLEGAVMDDGSVYHSFADVDHYHDEAENKMNKLSEMYRDPDGAKYYFDDTTGVRVKVLKEKEHEDHPDDQYHPGHMPQMDDDLAMPRVAPVSRKTFNQGWM